MLVETFGLLEAASDKDCILSSQAISKSNSVGGLLIKYDIIVQP